MTLRLILLSPLLLLLILFGLSNMAPTTYRLWPFDFQMEMPLAVATLVIAAISFLFGALISWLSSLPYRRKARRLEAAAQVLETELADLRGREARDIGPVPRVARPVA